MKSVTTRAQQTQLDLTVRSQTTSSERAQARSTTGFVAKARALLLVVVRRSNMMEVVSQDEGQMDRHWKNW